MDFTFADLCYNYKGLESSDALCCEAATIHGELVSKLNKSLRNQFIAGTIKKIPFYALHNKVLFSLTRIVE